MRLWQRIKLGFWLLDKVQVKTFFSKLYLKKKDTQKLKAAQANLKLFQYLRESNTFLITLCRQISK